MTSGIRLRLVLVETRYCYKRRHQAPLAPWWRQLAGRGGVNWLGVLVPTKCVRWAGGTNEGGRAEWCRQAVTRSNTTKGTAVCCYHLIHVVERCHQAVVGRHYRW